MPKQWFKRLAAGCLAAVVAASLTGCGLIPEEEETYQVQIVREDVADSYALATVDYGDVALSKTINCAYAQLNEERYSFAIGGRKVTGLFVQEGDDVYEGQLMASLDVSDLVEENRQLKEQILEDELRIRQEQELTDFYNTRLAMDSTGLADRETYILGRQECSEKIAAYESEIEYAQVQIAENEETISKADMYCTVNGTVSVIRDDMSGWTAIEGITAIIVIDTSISAFTSTDKNAIQYLSIGDSVNVEASTGVVYPATVTSLDESSGKIVFELDEPDYTISVGLRATVLLEIDEREGVLRAPRISVYGTDDMNYVYRLSDSGVREMVEVTAGLIGNNYVEIIDGLEAGESIILRSK